MKKSNSVLRAAVFIVLIVVLGCATKKPGESGNMLILGSALTKLSTAVESTVRYKHPAEELTDAQLLVLSTKHDPSLFEPFVKYTVRVQRRDRHAVVLVCTKDGGHGLLEDAGCTAVLDRHLWEGKATRPCEFTLNVEDVCKAE